MGIAYLLTYRHLRFLVFPPLTLALLAIYDYRKLLFATKGLRLRMWATYFDYFSASGKSIWLGFGPGTFEMVGPTIRIPIKGQADYATAWMHNDWLQILWEYGLVVFLFSLAFYIYVLVRSYHTRHLFCMIVGYGACMCFYSPLHFMLSQLLALALVIESFTTEDTWRNQKRNHQSPRKSRRLAFRLGHENLRRTNVDS